MFYFDKTKEDVIVRLDNIEYRDFFTCRETADF